MIYKSFDELHQEIGEIGFVEEILYSIVRVDGLPHAHPHEVVVFESGHLGQVLSLTESHVEVLLLEDHKVEIGEKVVRTNTPFMVKGSHHFLGKTIDPLTRD